MVAHTIHGDVSIGGATPVRWPCMVGVVPLLADCRRNRPVDQTLVDACTSARTTTVCQVLSGLGGVGKTEVAAGLAHRLWEQRAVDLLVWITATSRTGILSSYSQAAAAVTGINYPDHEQGAARFLAWLAEPHDRRWLIVLDDLTNVADVTGLWPPQNLMGCVVVTTRRRDAGLLAGRHLVDVGLFTDKEATRYLSDKLGDRPRRLDDVDGLAADLGYLPLALAQATAYIIDSDLTCRSYRQRLSDQRRKLADLAPDSLPDGHRATVAATWSLSIQTADQLAPMGITSPVLEMAALLDPNAIPTSIYATSAVLHYCSARAGRQLNAEDINDALWLLHRFNLAIIDPDSATMRVHGLVQRAVREAADTTHRTGVTLAAADAILQVWTATDGQPRHEQILRANTTALRSTAGDLLWSDEDGPHPVLIQAGESLGVHGLVGAAVDYFGELHDDALQHVGPDHPGTLTTRFHLTHWRGPSANPADTVAAFEALLADHQRILGPNHPDTLGIRHNLAERQGRAGNPAGAIATLEALLADVRRIYGSDHPDAIATSHNIAKWRRGRNSDGAELEAVLADAERLLGPDHPQTLGLRNNLAGQRGKAGDPAGAANAFRALVSDVQRVLGPYHPNTLDTRQNAASWQGLAGDAVGAAEAFAALLADVSRLVGPEHPRALTIRHHLADWRGSAGDPVAAVTGHRALFADLQRLHGPDHPAAVRARDRVAWWQAQASSSGCDHDQPPMPHTWYMK